MAGDPTLVEALLLGALQGATEWLPVSSSGHLVLAQEYLGVRAPIFFDLLLHVGTLAVVTLFLRKDVVRIVRGFLSAPRAMRAGGGARDVFWADIDRRMGVLVLAGSVPTAAIGFLLRPQFESMFESPLAVGVSLLVTGAFLLLLRWAPPTRGDGTPGLADALWVGIAQGAAVAPGVSRSGATIGAALLRGVDREFAVRLSFLLSIPAIAGASLFQASGAALGAAAEAWPVYLVGTATSAAAGWACLSLLVRVVRGAKMHYFAAYCLALGGLVVSASVGLLG
ncbi:MAG TPA: undecaprenyl-diphosphate phosphatase [Candidatus Thermoplasmatota archaeon]